MDLRCSLSSLKSIVSIFLIFILLASPAAASLQIYKTPLNATSPPGTERIIGGPCKIDYTASQPSARDPLRIQFKDQSKGNVTLTHWEFGDGTCYEGTNKNPVHVYKKKGYYISSYTIKTREYKFKLWVHKTIIIK
jgi:PKD repeat protein